jgi:signal transduction histidine kinase
VGKKRLNFSKAMGPAGEKTVLPLALGVLCLLLAGTILSMWWAGGTERRVLRAARTAQITALAQTLSESVRPLLVHNDLAAVRRLLVETRSAFHLADCRLTLPDGRVFADAEPGRINLQILPERWGGAPLDAETPASQNAAATTFVVTVPDRGTVVGHLQAAIEYPAWATSEMQLGLSCVGAAGAAGMLVLYRRSRTRFAALGMIQEALAAAKTGVHEPESLCLDESFGNDAKAWNALITEQQRLRQVAVATQAKDLLGGGGAGSARAPEMETACNALGEGLLVIGFDGIVRYANGAAGVFLAAPQTGLVGQKIADYIKDPRVQQALDTAFTGQDRQRRVVEVENNGGGDGETSTVLRFEIRSVRRNDLDEVVMVIYDVTQQRVADSSRNAFVAHVSHELRTPLTTIRLYLETIADDGEKDPAIRAKCLNVINQESRRLEHVVSEMLSASEIEAGAMSLNWDDVRLDAMFSSLQQDYEAQAKDKEQQLVFELPPKFPVIRADRERLALALHNMIGNGIKYTPPGGTVKIAVKTGGGSGKNVVVDVSDTGIGIEEKEHEKIFDRFYRSKDPRVLKITGTGLGLALARDIARLHGGDITLQSQLNKGTTFTLTLPMGPSQGAGR